MTLSEIIEKRDTESMRSWAQREAGAVLDAEEPTYHDVQDATDPHGPAMQVTLLFDRGECTREGRAWALSVVSEAYGGTHQEVDA